MSNLHKELLEVCKNPEHLDRAIYYAGNIALYHPEYEALYRVFVDAKKLLHR